MLAIFDVGSDAKSRLPEESASGDPKLAAVLLDKAAELNDKVRVAPELRFAPEHGRQSASTRRGAANVICDGFSVAEQENTRPSRLGFLQT